MLNTTFLNKPNKILLIQQVEKASLPPRDPSQLNLDAKLLFNNLDNERLVKVAASRPPDLLSS